MTGSRVLFYSHDSYGLGHFRRSLTVASFLARHIDGLSALMLTGIESAATFEKPRRVDFVKLPAIWKSGPDQYRSRHLRISFGRVRRMREQLVRSVTRAYDPAMLVVDNVPRGAGGELLSTLRFLRERRPRTRIVLLLRDVLDSPERISAQWGAQDVFWALERFYDEIWVAGCRAVFDPVQLYGFPPTVARKVKFCGYVVRSTSGEQVEDVKRELNVGERPLAVVSCGGGGDGYALIDTYVEAAKPLARRGLQSVVFLGPDMPPAERQTLKRKLLPLGEDFLTFDFRPDIVSFLRLASASVSMAGYNTICELVALGTPAIVVPRVYPRLEQLLRAQALAARGVLRMLHPEHLTPGALREALKDLLERGAENPRPAPAVGVDFGGHRRIARRVRRLLEMVGTP